MVSSGFLLWILNITTKKHHEKEIEHFTKHQTTISYKYTTGFPHLFPCFFGLTVVTVVGSRVRPSAAKPVNLGHRSRVPQKTGLI
jgi:hypothetical protein